MDEEFARALEHSLGSAPTPMPARQTTSKGLTAKSMGQAVADAINAKFKNFADRLSALEQKTKGFTYRGIWSETDTYDPGDFVTKGGGLWHCNSTTQGYAPGESNNWTLAVQRGRNGKDRR